jgi:hypothetical protein
MMQSKNCFTFLILLSLIGLLTACQSASETAAMDPAAVMDAYTAAINAHDIEAALAFVADDAVYERPTGQFKGKAEIRGFIEGLIARDVKVELIGERQVTGEQVRWTSHVSLLDPENPTGPRIDLMNNSHSTVQEGKITFHTAERASQ